MTPVTCSPLRQSMAYAQDSGPAAAAAPVGCAVTRVPVLQTSCDTPPPALPAGMRVSRRSGDRGDAGQSGRKAAGAAHLTGRTAKGAGDLRFILSRGRQDAGSGFRGTGRAGDAGASSQGQARPRTTGAMIRRICLLRRIAVSYDHRTHGAANPCVSPPYSRSPH